MFELCNNRNFHSNSLFDRSIALLMKSFVSWFQFKRQNKWIIVRNVSVCWARTQSGMLYRLFDMLLNLIFYTFCYKWVYLYIVKATCIYNKKEKKTGSSNSEIITMSSKNIFNHLISAARLFTLTNALFSSSKSVEKKTNNFNEF